MVAGMTVADLFHACAEQMQKGLGGRIVQITNDDEGNGYHTLFFTFSPVSDNATAIEDGLLHDDGYMPDEIILLG